MSKRIVIRRKDFDQLLHERRGRLVGHINNILHGIKIRRPDRKAVEAAHRTMRRRARQVELDRMLSRNKNTNLRDPVYWYECLVPLCKATDRIMWGAANQAYADYMIQKRGWLIHDTESIRGTREIWVLCPIHKAYAPDY